MVLERYKEEQLRSCQGLVPNGVREHLANLMFFHEIQVLLDGPKKEGK